MKFFEKKSPDYYICIFLFFLGIISRLPLIEKFQSHFDGPQYSIAIIKYNLSQNTPAFPGYPLYIMFGKFFYPITHDPHFSLLILSVLFSGIGAILFYITGKFIFNRSVGIISSFLYLSGPTFYFFGLTAYAYGLISPLSIFIALFVFFIIFKKRNFGFLLGFSLALEIGVRPQEIPMILPLFLLGFLYLKKRQKILSIVSFLTFTVLWLIPYLIMIGGLKEFTDSFLNLLKKGPVANSTIYDSISYLQIIVKDFFLTFTFSTLFLFYYLKIFFKFVKKKDWIKKIALNKHMQFFSAWIIPSFLVNLLIRSDHAGYQMTYLSAFVILISFAIYSTFKNKKLLIAVVLFCVIFNLLWFFRDRDPNFKGPYVPTSFHYSEIRKNDIKLGGKINYIKSHYNPKNTVILTSSNPWRPYMYYLKNFSVYDIEALYTKNIDYQNDFRIGLDWNAVQKENKERYISFPKNITSIIFTEDNNYSWIRGNYKKLHIIKLPGNSDITVLPIRPGQKINYSYHSIKII